MSEEVKLTEIIYENINSEYGYGMYGEFRVIIRKKDGYINVTKLCELGEKSFFNWKQNKNAKELVDHLASSLGIPRDGIITQPEGLPNHLRGTYLHPDLVPHVASWVSPKFGIKVSRIINGYIVMEYRIHLKEQERKLGIQQLTIDDLHRKLDEQNRKMDEQKERIEELLVLNQDMNGKLDVANSNIVNVIDRVGEVSKERVPLSRVVCSQNEHLIIVRLVNAPNERTPLPYYVMRAQKRSLDILLKSKREQYPDLRVILDLPYQPNPVELWNAARRKMGKKIEVMRNSFRLIGITETTFIERVKEIQSEKMQPYEESKEIMSREEDIELTVEQMEIKICNEPTESPYPVEQIQFQQVKQQQTVRRTETSVDAVQLERLSVPELRELCRQRGLRGYSKLRKAELINLL